MTDLDHIQDERIRKELAKDGRMNWDEYVNRMLTMRRVLNNLPVPKEHTIALH